MIIDGKESKILIVKALLFDFDGVILESADIKTAAYRKLLEEKHPPDKVDNFMDYHAVNVGISRYVKIQYFYEKILGIRLTEVKKKELLDKFSKIVFNEILQASFVEGMPGFLEENYKKLPLFVVTGTPTEEINLIIKKRKLNIYFKEIHGSPSSKGEIIKDLLSRYRWNPGEVIFFGDAESDMRAAAETSVVFIARVDENSKALENCKYKIRDFHGFKLENLSNWNRGDKV
ncbi:MAG: HAD hydrolase-like protein [Candidatus Ratteibacteria bacterium]|nr:HAD hydrolase-like protein [Candidatus Ratteibacteria bacterium]